MSKNRAAFPTPAVYSPTTSAQKVEGQPGMTLRQWLAGKALEGILAGDDCPIEEAVEKAIEAADLLCKRLEGEAPRLLGRKR